MIPDSILAKKRVKDVFFRHFRSKSRSRSRMNCQKSRKTADFRLFPRVERYLRQCALFQEEAPKLKDLPFMKSLTILSRESRGLDVRVQKRAIILGRGTHNSSRKTRKDDIYQAFLVSFVHSLALFCGVQTVYSGTVKAVTLPG